MKIESYFSLSDFFNYYISGVIWLFDITLAIWFLPGTLLDLPSIFNSLKGIETIAAGILMIVIPYVVGFSLLPLGEFTRHLWEGRKRKRYPHPRKWLLDKDKKMNRGPFGTEEISPEEIEHIFAKSKKTLGLVIKPRANRERRYLYFYAIRAFVTTTGGPAAAMADRSKNLMTLCESILIPAPLLFLLSGLHIFSDTRFDSSKLYISIILAALTFLMHRAIIRRFFRFEIYWVKHVYRALLAITSKS